MLWRWGIICLIAGVSGWVLMACADAMRPSLLPPWFDDYLKASGIFSGLTSAVAASREDVYGMDPGPVCRPRRRNSSGVHR